MNDRDVIKAELERLKRDRKFWLKLRQFPYAAIITDKVINMLIDFINHMPEEPASEDLEEELNRWRHEHFHGRRDKEADGEYLERLSQLDIARHFANWQKQKMTEALRTEYEKGRYDMREEMLGNSTDGYIRRNRYTKTNVLHLDVTCDAVQGFKDNDKVKLIIIKEE